MRRGVLFDFDGVLVDSEWLAFCGSRDWIEAQYGVRLPDSDCMRYAGWDGASMARDLVARYALPLTPTALQAALAAQSTLYESGALRLLPGARAFLTGLRGQGMRCALVSSTASRHILAACNRLGLTGLFDAIVCGDMVPRPKPDPAGYRCAMALLGLAPGDCLVIEDSPTGLAAGRAAGACTVGFRGATIVQDVSAADFTADGYDALLQPAVRRRLGLPV